MQANWTGGCYKKLAFSYVNVTALRLPNVVVSAG